MSARNLVARVRETLERAADGRLEPAELAARASDLIELKARVARLAELGFGDMVELAPEVDALLARLAPASIAA